MSEDVAAFVRFLQESADVEWYRFAETANDSGVAQPPLVVWRYKEPIEPAVLDSIRRSIRAENRLVTWYFDKPGRNWVLVPERVTEIQMDRNLATDTNAIAILAAEDPEFCEQAASDFNAIAAEVRGRP